MNLSLMIAQAKSPFDLRYILNKHPIDLKAHRHQFQRRLDSIKLYYKNKCDVFFNQVIKNLQFDFDAEVVEGKHRTPPPPPLITETVGGEVMEESIDFVSKLEVEIPLGSNNILKDLEYLAIKEVLEQTDWNRTKAALRLGISIRTLRNKLSELKIMGHLNEKAVTMNELKIKNKRARQRSKSPYTMEERFNQGLVESAEHTEVRDNKPQWVKDIERKEAEEKKKAEAEKVEVKETKVTRVATPPHFPSLAKCCPTKLEWISGSGICLHCHKGNPKE